MKRFELSCRIFIHSLLVYAVFTLPALFIPFIFVISLLIACLYGLVAVTVFWFCFNCLSRMPISPRITYQFVLIAVMVSVIFAFQVFGWTNHLVLPDLFGADENVWDSGPFLFLPLLAVVAGWIGVYVSRTRILKQLLNGPYATTA